MSYNENINTNYPSNPRKGKGAYIPGKPKKKAHQHPIDESGPPIRIPKAKQGIVVYKGPDKSRTEMLIDRIKEGKEPVSISIDTAGRANDLLKEVYQQQKLGAKLYRRIGEYLQTIK